MTTPEKDFLKKITDVSNVPFGMAVLNDKGEITEYGPYQVEFAHEIPHIPLYTTPQTKPLSDERLQEIYKKVYEEGQDNQVVALARAIEKEHGIL